MKLIYGKARGSKAFRAGMGIEELEIDFSKLPNGLIAICGKNGSGKTTILDLFGHLYRMQPYKLRESKTWSPDAFSYYNEFYGRDGYLERIVEIGGQRYKSVIMIDAERRKQECYLYREDGATWVPYNASVRDGKTKAYDLAVEELLGSPSLFFSSVFRSQDARKLSSYPRSEILSIVCELLNIDHIKAQGEKSGEVVIALNGMVSDLGYKKFALGETLNQRGGLIERKNMLDSEISSGEQDLRVFQGGLAAHEQQIHDLELAFAAEAVTRQRVVDMEKQKSYLAEDAKAIEEEQITRGKELLDERARIEGAMTAESMQLISDKAALDHDLAVCRQAATKGLTDIEEKKQAALLILNRADEITAAVARETAEETSLTTARAELEHLREEFAGLQKKQIDTNNFLADIILKEHDLNAERRKRTDRVAVLEREIDACQKQNEQLTGIDCTKDESGWVKESCRLISFAVAAKQKIPGLQQEIETLSNPTEAETAIAAQIENMRAEHAAMGDAKTEAAACAAAGKEKAALVAALETALAETRKTARLAADLETARNRLVELAEHAEAITRNLEVEVDRHAQKTKKREEKSSVLLTGLREQQGVVITKQSEIFQAFQQKLAGVQNQLETVTEEIRKLEATLAGDMEAEIVKLREAMDGIRKSITAQETSLKALYGQRGTVQSQIEALAESEKQLAEIEAEIAGINEESVNWRLLQKACSNDGIIQLEIDDSGPAISALTNDLLREIYGPRFTIRMETQAAKADGGLREVFDFTIFDAERDEEKSIRDLSGGETCYIEDAITRAFCLYNLNRSSRVYETLFTDERDGSLDEGRKTEFLAIKRRAIEIGTHSQEWFISQTPQLVELADARIVLKQGGVSIC